jgi:protein-tyrosine phosphatase
MKRPSTLAVLVLLAGCSGATRPPTSADTDGGVVVLAGDAGAATASCTRRVLQSGVTNARDIAGWPTAGGPIACRRILRGGALGGLTPAGCDEFTQIGIRTIIDLREQAAQASAPPPSCATQNAQHVSAAMPKLLPDTPENYVALLDQTDSIRQVFSALAAAGSYPVYLHCEIGRDRASVVTALVLLALGADRQTVMDEFLLSNQAGVAVKAECMSGLLDAIAARGGIEVFLASLGIDTASLDTLRRQALVKAP